MYVYSIHGHEYNMVLMHEINYTQLEFEQMCEEAPKIKYGRNIWYDSTKIYGFLIKYYGFVPLVYQAGFFADKDVDEDEDENNYD